MSQVRRTAHRSLSKRWSITVSSPELSAASSKLRAQETSILTTHIKKEGAPPYTPRTCERGKDDFRQTESELDSFFRSVADRRRTDCDEKKKSVGGGDLTLLLAEAPSQDDSTERQFSRPNARQRLQMRIDAARADVACGKSPKEGCHKVPLTHAADGEVCVDVKALQRLASDCPRGLGAEQRTLTSQEISRACKEKAAKLRRSQSAPVDYVKENRTSSSLKCLRHEARQRDRLVQSHRRRSREDSAMKQRRMKTDVLRSRAFSATLPDRAATAMPAAAIAAAAFSAPLMASSKKASPIEFAESRVRGPNPEGSQLGFCWVASEAFLSSVHHLLAKRRREKAWELWREALKFITCLRFLRRLTRKKHAAELLKTVLEKVPLSFRMRSLYRQRKAAACRLQRAWRNFSMHMNTLVQALLARPWRMQETRLLEAIFSTCPTDSEVVVNNVDLLTGNEEEDENQDPSSAVHRHSASSALHLRKTKSSVLGTSSVAVLSSLPLNNVPTSMRRQTMSLKRPATQPLSMRSCDSLSLRHSDRLASVSSRPSSANRPRLRSRESDCAHQRELQEMLSSAMQRRLQKRVRAHHFCSGVAARLLRRELLERLYDFRAQAEIVSHRAASKQYRCSMLNDPFDALWRLEGVHDEDGSSSATGSCTTMEVGTALAAVWISDTEVRDLVLCLHYGHGVRPSRPEVCNVFYHACLDSTVNTLGETLSGCRSIRESLQDRQARRQHPHTNGKAVRPKGNEKQRPLRPTRPASAPVQRLDPSLQLNAVLGQDGSGHSNDEASSTRVRLHSFEDCFDRAEAFCRNVLATAPEDDCADTGGVDVVEDDTGSLRHLLPPGLAALEVGDLPGLHAVGLDLDAEKATTEPVLTVPAKQPGKEAMRPSTCKRGQRGSVRQEWY